MYKSLLSQLIVLLTLPACTGHAPSISVVCEENNLGNCIIKWETAPITQGQIKIYSSTDPNNIPEDEPIAEIDIKEQRIVITNNDPMKRYYYLLVFNNKFRVKTSSRNINMPGIQNFRDLGGYRTNTNKSVRWGMIYRSAQLDSLDKSAIVEMKNIGIKSIIDLRSQSERSKYNPIQPCFHLINIPIPTGDMEDLLHQLKEGKMKSDIVYSLVQQMNRDLVTKYHKEFQKLFRVLSDVTNYPLVIHCSTGKGRTGIASALILYALGINTETIMEDYRLSNDYFNIPKASQYAYALPVNSQEAITTLFSAQEDFLNAAREQIESQYGSIDNYLTSAIKLDNDHLSQLKNILLQ